MCVSGRERERQREKLKGKARKQEAQGAGEMRALYLSLSLCSALLCTALPNMIIMKANVKETWGELISLSITKAKAK